MEEKGGVSRGEVRKIHIIYFLSRKGVVEHPHLIHVRHLSRTGVHLRDVKRWLSELRGKDMPESFAWSYKRRYKARYVWQDLLDQDLITPISDNEYVIKGSEISSITFNKIGDLTSYSEKDYSKTVPPFTVDIIKDPIEKKSQQNSISSSTKTSFEIEELPSFSSDTSTEDTTKEHQEHYHFVCATKHEEQKKTEASPLLLRTFLNKNQNDIYKIKKGGSQKEANSSKTSRDSSNQVFRKSSSYSGSGATHMFLNLITCGIVDTNDSAMTTIKRKDGSASMMNISSAKQEIMSASSLQKQRDKRKEGSKRSYNMSHSNKKNTIPAAYKFVNGPSCSQCGRQFKLEKLHTHMKSCRKMKAFAKAAKSLSTKLQSLN